MNTVSTDLSFHHWGKRVEIILGGMDQRFHRGIPATSAANMSAGRPRYFSMVLGMECKTQNEFDSEQNLLLPERHGWYELTFYHYSVQ